MKKIGLFGLFCIVSLLGLGLTGGQPTSSVGADSGALAQGLSGNTLPDDMNPTGAVAELVRLVQAGVDKEVILAYIDAAPRLFQLDADDIIYLTDLGTPAEVIKAVMVHDERLIQAGISPDATLAEGAPEKAEEQPAAVSGEYFEERLSPYGAWVYIDGYGRCWRPTVAIYNTGWRPYCDNGRWIYTDHGWYWSSGYSWGSATFHYGRWFRHSHYGWCWWPDTVWAPSWVCWRYDRSYCGWAPLPPYTVYRQGIGICYRGTRVVVGYDFDLCFSSYTFVSIGNFCSPRPSDHCIEDGEAERIYNRTVVSQQISYNSGNRRIINSGIPHREIETHSRRKIRPVSIAQAKKNRVPRSKPQAGSAAIGPALAGSRTTPRTPKAAAPSTTGIARQQPNRPPARRVSSNNSGGKSGREPSLKQEPRTVARPAHKVKPPQPAKGNPPSVYRPTLRFGEEKRTRAAAQSEAGAAREYPASGKAVERQREAGEKAAR